MGLSNEDFSKIPDDSRALLTDPAGNAVHPETGEYLSDPTDPASRQQEQYDIGDDGGSDDGMDTDWIPPEKFADLDPEVKKLLRKRRDAQRKAEVRYEHMLERMQALEQQVTEGRSMLEGQQKGGRGNGEQSLQDFDEGALRGWLGRYDKVMNAARLNPENEALQEEAAKLAQMDPQAVRDALTEKIVSKAVGGLEEKLVAGQAEQQADARLRSALSEAGLPVEQLINPSSRLNARATEIVQKRARALGISERDRSAYRAALYGAYLEAHNEMQKAVRQQRRGPPGVEGQWNAPRSLAPTTPAKSGHVDPQVAEVTDFLLRSGMI
jgi:hypothetical protein